MNVCGIQLLHTKCMWGNTQATTKRDPVWLGDVMTGVSVMVQTKSHVGSVYFTAQDKFPHMTSEVVSTSLMCADPPTSCEMHCCVEWEITYNKIYKCSAQYWPHLEKS